MINVVDNTYRNEVSLCNLPVVIDFYADWCGPCRAMSPVFKAAEEQFKDKVKFVKIDIDTTSLSIRFGVRSVPTFVIMYKDKLVDVVIGVRSKQQFADWITGVLETLPAKL